MIIESRFTGPADSGNGGWSAGVFAGAFRAAAGDEPIGGKPVEVTLRLPPPLAVPLSLDGAAVRTPDGTLVAELARVAEFDAVVAPADWATATAAARTYPGFTDHPFPTCYVCGPERTDGLRVFPGRLPDGRTAAPFVAPEDTGPATVWAALDCPGGWAVLAPGRRYVLGRIAALVAEVPAAGDQCVVTGELIATQGRKAQVQSTLRGPDGRLLGQARATWIAI